MLFPHVAEWLALALAVTPQTPIAEVRAVSAKMWAIFRGLDPTMQATALQALDRSAKNQQNQAS